MLLIWLAACALLPADDPTDDPLVESDVPVDPACFFDGDGDGVLGTPVAHAGDDCVGASLEQPDCDDADPDTWPGAPERCDGVDRDCDGVRIEDEDGDGWPTCGPTRPEEVWFRVGLGAQGAVGDRFGERVAWADVDGDGTPELVVSAPYADGLAGFAGRVEVRSLARGADGVVSDALRFAVQGTAFDDRVGFEWALLGDVTGDGLPELALAVPRDGIAERSEVRVYASPLVGLPVLLDTTASGDEVPARHVWSAGDLDGDGLGDLVVVAEPPWPDPPVVRWIPGDVGGLAWEDAVDLPAAPGVLDRLPSHHGDVLAADVDGDGWDDLVLGASVLGGVTLVPGGPDGPGPMRAVLCPGAPTVTTCGHAMALHDLVGDPAPDLVLTAGNSVGLGTHAAGGGLAILQGGPSGPLVGGSAVAGVYLPNDDPAVGVDDGAVIVLGDVTGDGRPELVATGGLAQGNQQRGDVRMWRSAPGGGWVPRALPLEPPQVGGLTALYGPKGLLAVGDMDGDGLPDLLVADPGWRPSANEAYFGRMSLWRGADFGDPAPTSAIVP